MKPWMAIGAVALIFITGAVTGALGLHASRRNAPDPPPWPSIVDAKLGNSELMQRELGLSPDQARRVDAILNEGRTRTRRILDRCQPDLRDELRRVREAIAAELTPDQRSRFDDFLRKSRSRGKHRPDREEPSHPPGSSLPP